MADGAQQGELRDGRGTAGQSAADEHHGVHLQHRRRQAGLAYSVVDATREHVLDLRDRLRSLDARECSGQGISPQRVLYRTFRRSMYAKTALSEGRVIAMWGMGGSLVDDEGRPWLLTAPEVERFPVAIVREARYAVAEMLTLRRVLWNYVLADYAQAIRLLEVLGFTIDEPQRIAEDVYRRFWVGR